MAALAPVLMARTARPALTAVTPPTGPVLVRPAALGVLPSRGALAGLAAKTRRRRVPLIRPSRRVGGTLGATD